jgi:hypothetical protein
MSAAPATDEVACRLAVLLAEVPDPRGAPSGYLGPDVFASVQPFLERVFTADQYACWDAAARAVLGRPPARERTALLRALLLKSRYGFDAPLLAALVQGLYDADALDDTVLHPLLRWRSASNGGLGPADPERAASPGYEPGAWELVSTGCREALADSLDRLADLLTLVPTDESLRELPRWRPRGPRFFLRALELWRLAVEVKAGGATALAPDPTPGGTDGGRTEVAGRGVGGRTEGPGGGGAVPAERPSDDAPGPTNGPNDAGTGPTEEDSRASNPAEAPDIRGSGPTERPDDEGSPTVGPDDGGAYPAEGAEGPSGGAPGPAERAGRGSTDARVLGRAAVYLAAARLSGAERGWLVGELAGRSLDERRAAVALGSAAGAGPLLELLDAENARPVVELLRHGIPEIDPESGAVDVSALRAMRLPAARAAELLPLLCASRAALTADPAGLGTGAATAEDGPAEIVLAYYGLNRVRVRKRLRRHAFSAIQCLGLLPFAEGESVLDRFLELRACEKAAASFGAERRANHLRAVRAGLWHLAQLTGYPSADRLEWDLEARLATGTPESWTVAGYELSLDLTDPAVPLRVARAGKVLASVPARVRADPSYAEVRTARERLREQSGRLRGGLVEALVGGGEPLDADAFARLLGLPAARGMLSGLVLRAADGEGEAYGLLDLTGPGPALVGLDGERVGLGPDTRVGAAHPLHLAARDRLDAWQREIVRRGIRQPVKQVLREVYRLSPADQEDGGRSTRFAGRWIDGAVAARLLTARGWRASSTADQAFATRGFAGCHAVLHFDEVGHFLAEGPALTGPVEFVTAVDGPGHRLVLGSGVPLADVPALIVSEALRDIDLVVSVAGRPSPDDAAPDGTAPKEEAPHEEAPDERVSNSPH